MKRTIAIIGAVLLSLGLAMPALGNGQEQVTICHAAGLDGTTQYVEITVGYPAAYGPAGHFSEPGTPNAGHEDDYEGPCPVTTTTTQATTTTQGEGTTTTQPEVTTTTQGPGPGPTTTVAPTTTIPFDVIPTTTVAPTTTAAPVLVPLAPAAPPEELPFTGFDPAALAGVASLLAVSGAGLVRAGRR